MEVPSAERFTFCIRDWPEAVEVVEGKSQNGMMCPLGAHFLESFFRLYVDSCVLHTELSVCDLESHAWCVCTCEGM